MRWLTPGELMRAFDAIVGKTVASVGVDDIADPNALTVVFTDGSTLSAHALCGFDNEGALDVQYSDLA